MPCDKLALLFPGQGAHCHGMLDAHASFGYWQELYGTVCDVLGYGLLEKTSSQPESVNSNLTSSMLTVLASCLALRSFNETDSSTADFLAGYSVGQLTALHAAGCFDFHELVKLVLVRAQLMDECFKTAPGAMLAVIGLPLSLVEEICAQLHREGRSLWVSNINCLGQYSLSGSREAVKAAQIMLAQEKPKKLLALPVSGAWHSPLLESAQTSFAHYLSKRDWLNPKLAIIDNVTGDFFPDNVSAIKEQLVKHLTHPVRWETGLKLLVSQGCTRFVEIGYGNTLTKFGFFIDRSAVFASYYGVATAVCVE